VYKEFEKEVTSRLTYIRLKNRKNEGSKVMRGEVPREDRTKTSVKRAC